MDRDAGARRRTGATLLGLAVLLMAVSGCKQIEVANHLDQRLATRIVVKLREQGIPAKLLTVGAGEEQSSSVTVPEGAAPGARQVLVEYSLLPDERYESLYATVDKSLGFATESQLHQVKKAKRELQLAERIVENFTNVVRAEVTLAQPLPDPKALLRGEMVDVHASGAVGVRYIEGTGSHPPNEREIRELVANAVEGMRSEDVEVVLTKSLPVTVHTARARGASILVLPFSVLTLALAGALVFLGMKNQSLDSEIRKLEHGEEPAAIAVPAAEVPASPAAAPPAASDAPPAGAPEEEASA